MPAVPFIIPAVTSIATSFIGSHAAKSAASQQQQSGQQAAQSFQPYQQGGNAAFDKALGMYGIAPTASTTPPPNPAMPPALNPMQKAGLQPSGPQFGGTMTPQAPPPPQPPLGANMGLRPSLSLSDYGSSGGSSYAR